MKKTRIALAQICPVPGNLKENADKILHFLRKAAEEKADLAVFPECSLTGYSTALAGEIAITREDPQAERIRKAAKEEACSVCFGYIEREEDRLYITQELYAGGEVLYYHKTHLGSREQAVFAAGDAFPVLDVPIRTGIQLCVESHIPEISAAERKKGAELLLIPYASPMSGTRCLENWSVHLPARASDNGVYVAACNLLFPPAEDSGKVRGGGLAVWDPKGRRIADHYGTEENLLICCDLEGPLPRERTPEDMHNISYFDRKREELFDRKTIAPAGTRKDNYC